MRNFVSFDLETTGLSEYDEIIEIGLVRIRDGKITEKFSTLVKPAKKIPRDITELTGINQKMLDEAPRITDVIDKTKEFIGEDIIVGHNVVFDIGFIKKFISLDNEFVDTLKLAKIFYPFSQTHSLGHLAKYLGIKIDVEHRALDDAITTAMIILKMNDDIINMGFKTVFEIMDTLSESPERNYIKGLLKDVKNEMRYDYEIPENYCYIDKSYKEINLIDDIQKEIYDNIRENNLYILEIASVKDLKDFVILPILKFIKENNEKFILIKTEGENINDFLRYINNLANENDCGIKAVFINNKESYLCLRKFNEVNGTKNIEPFTMASLKFWIKKTKTGNINEIKNIIKDDDMKISVDETCSGEECEFFDRCFYYEMIRKENESDIIITNYMNFFRNELEYNNFVFFDAEEIEEKATQGFSIIIEFKEIEYIIKKILESSPQTYELIKDDYDMLKENFILMGKEIIGNNEKFKNGIIFSEYKDRFISISEIMTTIRNKSGNKFIKSLNRILDKLNNLFIKDNDYVMKVNFTKPEDILSAFYIFYPVLVWNRTCEKISGIKRGLFISRTVTTGCNFDFFKRISGIDRIKREIRTSSYNFSKDVIDKFRIYISTFHPPYNSNEFNKDVGSMLKKVLGGFRKSYVMFTSYTNAEKVFDLIDEKEEGAFIKHAKYKNLNNVLKNVEEYIVLGTTHLFDRVKEKKFDILVIPKIPFPNMADEIVKRRAEAFSKTELNSFNDYLLPTAIMKIKKSLIKILNLSFDKCAIIILDRRMLEKDYSSMIIDSLPVDVEKVESNEELKEKLLNFFNG